MLTAQDLVRTLDKETEALLEGSRTAHVVIRRDALDAAVGTCQNLGPPHKAPGEEPRTANTASKARSGAGTEGEGQCLAREGRQRQSSWRFPWGAVRLALAAVGSGGWLQYLITYHRDCVEEAGGHTGGLRASTGVKRRLQSEHQRRKRASAAAR
ncbi:hypothetical protein CYMTET_4276 [Cymbomonas tetramitiformis]|uniref:Uncharacterized protein n=1 Tax=Cymbomonas tetramitiformis TaxID=36881 RepID=A0AAE0H1Y1_9CHLO|nr:hypothetical protein CYMTET_4276 [Cymbomonas tetramitiformis]